MDKYFEESLFEELRQSIERIEDPVQRTLGKHELRNPSVRGDGSIENRAKQVGDLGLFVYEARIFWDKVGTDFMTNQPKYEARECPTGKGKLLYMGIPKKDEEKGKSNNYFIK